MKKMHRYFISNKILSFIKNEFLQNHDTNDILLVDCYNLTSFDAHVYLCLVHFIWTERRISKLVLNVKCLLLLSFLSVAKLYNLGHIQGIIRVH